MTWTSIVRTGAALAVVAGMQHALASDVTRILADMQRALSPGRDIRADITFDIENEHGERVRWTGKYYGSTQPPRRKLVLETPLDLRGVSLTIIGGPALASAVEIYLPFVRRVRTISHDMRGVSFLGTDFNFEDLGVVDLDYHQHTLVEENAHALGRRCTRVDSIPDKSWWYGRISRCIDRQDAIPRLTEFYDPAGLLLKRRTIVVEKIAGHPTPIQMTMEVVPAHTKTTLTLSNVEYDTDLPASIFETH